MSVTFKAARAPTLTKTQPCGCGGEKDCPDCQGTDVYSYPVCEGEVNFANDNARAILKLLGYDGDLQGEWRVEDLSLIRSKLMFFLNSKTHRIGAIRPCYMESNLRVMPLTDAGIIRRLHALLILVARAQANQWGSIYWA